MNFAIFVLYGLVMNTIPPMIFEGRRSPKTLVVMIIVVFGLCGLVTHVDHHDI